MCFQCKGQKVIERIFGPEMTLVLHKTMIATRQKYSQVMERISIEKLVNVHVTYRKKEVFKHYYQYQSGICVALLPHRSEQEVFVLRLAETLALLSLFL